MSAMTSFIREKVIFIFIDAWKHLFPSFYETPIFLLKNEKNELVFYVFDD